MDNYLALACLCAVCSRAFVWAVFCVAVKSRIEKVARFLLNCVESLLDSVIFLDCYD